MLNYVLPIILGALLNELRLHKPFQMGLRWMDTRQLGSSDVSTIPSIKPKYNEQELFSSCKDPIIPGWLPKEPTHDAELLV